MDMQFCDLPRWSVARWREEHFPDEPDPDRTKNVSPCEMLREDAVCISVRLFQPERRFIRLNDEDKTGRLVKVVRHDDDARLAGTVVMQSD
jgi:hypothetical protein